MRVTAKGWSAGLRAVWARLNGVWAAARWEGGAAGGGERSSLDDYLEIPTYIRRGQAGVIRQGWAG